MARPAAPHLVFVLLAIAMLAQVRRFVGLAPDVELWSLLVGLVCGLAALALVHHAAVQLCERSPAWLVAGAWLAACSPFALWALGGLEEPLYALALVTLPLALHRGVPVLAAAAALALAACRPEGSLLVALVLAHGIHLAYRDGQRPPWLTRFALVATPAVMALQAVRFMVLGAHLPALHAPELASVAGYFYGALVTYLPVPVLVLGAAAISFRGSEGPLFTLPPLLVAGQLFAVAVAGGDARPLYRLLVPLAPLAFLLAAAGLETVLGLIGPFLSRLDRAAALAGIVLCALKLAAVPADQLIALEQARSVAALETAVRRRVP